MLTVFAALMTTTGMVLAGLATYVAFSRGSRMWWALAATLASVAWWGLAYAVELKVPDVDDKSLWGALKYIGIAALAPAWLTFVLHYTGRGRLVTRKLVGLLLVEPVIVVTLLLVPSTRTLVRSYPDVITHDLPIVTVGPVFWVHLVYNNVILVGATALFVASMVRLARTYRRMAWVLVAAALLPWAANLLHNFAVSVFARIDLTPFAFVLVGALLVWGLFRERLIDLAPIARSAVLDGMEDAVFVLDPWGRIVDVNPAAVSLSTLPRAALVGRRLADVRAQSLRLETSPGEVTVLTLGGDAPRRTFDVSRRGLTDSSGRHAGELVVLRDVTERVETHRRLTRVLGEQSRIASALQESMIPPRLPDVAGVELVSRYLPAGDGSEVGGDFLDVFLVGESTWAFALGDVAGKGAEAAAVGASVRYTLRALAQEDVGPADTLTMVNAKLVQQPTSDRHCTLVYGHLCPEETPLPVTLTLAGHPHPLVLRGEGDAVEVGSPGTALKLFSDPDLSDVRFDLAPGDLLCLYSDGLSEARRGREEFGVDRVARVLREHRDAPLEEVADAIVATARGFCGGTLSDDLALLLLRAPRPLH